MRSPSDPRRLVLGLVWGLIYGLGLAILAVVTHFQIDEIAAVDFSATRLATIWALIGISAGVGLAYFAPALRTRAAAGVYAASFMGLVIGSLMLLLRGQFQLWDYVGFALAGLLGILLCVGLFVDKVVHWATRLSAGEAPWR